VTRVVDRLAARGLVCRRACPTDRRSTYAVVTDSGRATIAAVLPRHLELVEELLGAPLDTRSRSALSSALRDVRDAVRPTATAGAARSSGPTGSGAPAGATAGA
jgi:MarR family transcriptional regulator, 2-MHQ and catechol-resistance regulon repressor